MNGTSKMVIKAGDNVIVDLDKKKEDNGNRNMECIQKERLCRSSEKLR